MENAPEMSNAVKDLESLIKASINVPSDLHVSPSTITDSARRFCETYVECIFQTTEDSKNVMAEMANKYKDYATNDKHKTEQCT